MLLTCVAVYFPAYAANTGIALETVKVSARVYYFRGESGMASKQNRGFMSNAGFVVTDDGVVVFDALATPALGEAMLAAIRKVTSHPVRRVIISHYHADHFYGLQALKTQGAEVWAHENGRSSVSSDAAAARLAERRVSLSPWVNGKTKLIPADRWIRFPETKQIAFDMGGVRFRLIDSNGAHTAEDIMLYVEGEGVLFAGDLFFTGRLPFVGEANSKLWLETLDRMLEVRPSIVIPGHGEASRRPLDDMKLTRDYLMFLRQEMGSAVNELLPFEEAYNRVDWSRFGSYPAFQQANRINAYGTYLLMEKESLGKE
ncbi:MBL fold metallo-hydrolase [Noviherbaspirillum saxi]|uniref:MBL fold metallo-hydrolase n=1 Tax=Noviherbaspirillum saxi TaxID=2320863 RepID=UPI001F39D2AC|nr:MBL fold metallo-hydrolase [Noviherbaspirillum saxi]